MLNVVINNRHDDNVSPRTSLLQLFFNDSLEVGVASRGEVKKILGAKTRLDESKGAGQNEYKYLLRGTGAGLGLDGIDRIEFEFDSAEKLTTVAMYFGEKYASTIQKKLSGKYIHIISSRLPDRADIAIYRHGKSNIILMVDSGSASLTYLTEADGKKFIDLAIETKRNEAKKF